MPANTEPIFSKVGSIGFSTAITAASTLYTGIHANDAVVYSADATNGAYVYKLRFKSLGTNVATVGRVYINDGTTSTSTHYGLFGELTLSATTTSATQGQPDIDYNINLALPPGYRIVVGIGTAVSAGWMVNTVAGTY